MESTKTRKRKVYRNVEELLDDLKSYGRYQKILNIMLAILYVPASFQIMIMYFIAVQPKWRCLGNSSLCFSTKVHPSSNMSRCNIPRHHWEYVEPKDYSLITDLDLDCGDEWLSDMALSITYLGWAIGSLTLGYLANRIGRKKVIFLSTLMIIITVFVSAFVTNIYLFIVLRFVVGFFKSGNAYILYMLMGECVNSEHRSFASLIITLAYNTALVILGLKAYYIRKWRTLLIMCSVPYMFVLLFHFYVQESIRWLYLKGMNDRIVHVCSKIADWNRVNDFNYDFLIVKTIDSEVKTNPKELFRSHAVTRRSIVLIYCWFMATGLYYAFFNMADDFGASMHITFVLFALLEVPANMFGSWCMDRFGRKCTIPGSMLVGSFLSTTIAFVMIATDSTSVRVLIGAIVQGCLVIAFNFLIPWTVEILTTDIRSLGMGIFSAAGRTGGVMSPWIANRLNLLHPVAPFLAVGILGCSTSYAMWCLPETKGQQMKEVDDQENLPLLKTKGIVQKQ